ncbi:Rha family transcriptional regulator [Arcobacter ellisii]|uniref:Phage regulatory protein n=1 Tax=Arcobacter ellisii TaxID=913109 RepID=A0A347U8B9_9BACT|nr:Rha family transcriptional regulator [Arcobacter ellisii]AXX95097.1 putative phage regulatory protein [Arcobacter ellisii]RXI28987.1 transcriptional regulator [Arcobacter ellisii]
MQLISKHKIKGENIPVTTSRKVAEIFEKRHADVIRAIENLIDGGDPNFGLSSNELNIALVKMFFISQYKDKKGETRKEYLLTQDGFTLLAMGFTGPKALEFKLAYIKAFNEMKKELEDFRFQRKIAKEGYKGLTGSLKDELGDDAKIYHFSNEADMLNKIVLGLTAKQYCDIHQVDRKCMRDHLSSKDLEVISELEKYDEFLIRRGFTYKQREEELSEYHLRRLRKTLEVA